MDYGQKKSLFSSPKHIYISSFIMPILSNNINIYYYLKEKNIVRGINLDKEEKENKEMPEDPVEEKPMGEGEIQDKAKEAVEEPKTDETKPVEDKPAKDVETESEEPIEKNSEKTEDVPKPEKKPVEEKQAKPKKQEKTSKAEKPKKESQKTKKEKPKKEDAVDDDFKYIVRISNTDIDGDKKLLHGLTSIKGIGIHISSLIIDNTGFDPNKKVGKLSDSEVEKIQQTVDRITELAPVWMLNHRKDYETGEDIHLIGSEIDLKLRDEINIMKKIRCYRGIRHESGLPVRGQRTRGNNRRGLSLGVSKKRP